MRLVDLDTLNVLLLTGASRSYRRRSRADLKDALQLGLDPGPDENHTLDAKLAQRRLCVGKKKAQLWLRGAGCRTRREPGAARTAAVQKHGAPCAVPHEAHTLESFSLEPTLLVLGLRGKKEYHSSVEG